MRRFIGMLVTLCMLMCTLVCHANEPPLQNIEWYLEGGTLTVTGEGAMPDYKTEDAAPWAHTKNEVTKIVVSDGITHIGSLAFYGFTNATEAIIADSVKSIGLCAFDYTEGTKTSISSVTADYAFALHSDATTVKAGDEFTVSIVLNADFKNITTIQSTLVYDDEKIIIDKENAFDTDWIQTVNKDSLGYISQPIFGFVANNVRLAYISSAGVRIDQGSPLYTAGKTEITIAKIKCKALCDIKDINTEHFIIKNSEVLVTEDKLYAPQCSETQLACATRLPMKQITIKSASNEVESYAKENSIAFEKAASSVGVPSVPALPANLTIFVDGKEVTFPDTIPYKHENTVMIPIRPVYEAIGATVSWDNDTRTVFVSNRGDFFAMQIGKATVFTAKGNVNIDYPAVIKDSRTVVPVSVFASSFGFKAEYKSETNSVTITTK